MKVVKQVYVYLGAYAINAIVSFFTVSLLTKPLSQEDYGIINLYSSFLIFLMPFITGGILYPLSAEYFKRDEKSYSEYFSHAQVIPLVSLLIFTVVCAAAANPLARFLRVTPFWVFLMPLTAWFIFINETSMTIARNKNKPWLFAGFSVGKSLVEMVLTLALVMGLAWSWQGRLASAVIAPLLLLIFSIYFFSKWKLLTGPISRKQVKMIFLFSFPFIFERLSIFILGYSDKYFIDKFDLKGTAEVGLYSLAGQFASIVFIVIMSLNNAYHPYLFKQLAGGHKHVFHKSTGWYIAACGAVVGGLFLGLPLLFRWFIDPKFSDALPYTYILTGGYFMWGIYNAFLGYLIYLSKNRQILYISITGMIISLACNAVLVPRFGAIGAAYTSIGTYTVMALICFLFARKYFISHKA